MISAVIPVMNEEESLQELYERLTPALKNLDTSYEIIFIDDGSTDNSLVIMKNLAIKDKQIRIFSFRRNFGKAEALTLGFQKAQGDYIVTLDADLQDKPEEMHKLFAKLQEGYDIVSGWRKDRKDKVKMKFISKVFNKMMGIMWGVRLHDYNCGLKLYINDAAKSLHLYGGMHRFIPLLAANNGFRVTEVPIIHEQRKYGKSKYGFTKIKDLPDMFTLLFVTKYNTRPLHFFGAIGGICCLIGAVMLAYLAMIHFLGQRIGNRPLLIFGSLFMLVGVQIFFTGFLADLMIHIAHSPKETMHLRLRYTTDKQKEITL